MIAKVAPLALFSVFVATAGQLLLKSGMDRVGYVRVDQMRHPLQLAGIIIRTPQVLIGLSLFVLSAVSWLLVLSRVPLSVAYPFVGLTYVLTTLFSKFVLRESVPSIRWLGVGLILAGIVIIGQSVPDGTPAEEAPAVERSAHL